MGSLFNFVLIRIEKTSQTKFKVTKHNYSHVHRRWQHVSSWDEVGPVGLEAYLERAKVDPDSIKSCIFALLNYPRKVAIINTEGMLKFII